MAAAIAAQVFQRLRQVIFMCRSRADSMSELIVVTLIVAADGGVKIPKIQSREDLTQALNKLGALRSEQVSRATLS